LKKEDFIRRLQDSKGLFMDLWVAGIIEAMEEMAKLSEHIQVVRTEEGDVHLYFRGQRLGSVSAYEEIASKESFRDSRDSFVDDIIFPILSADLRRPYMAGLSALTNATVDMSRAMGIPISIIESC
jgi:hypothetical protein